jgi:phage-related protein
VSKKNICSKLVYDGEIFRIEFYVAASGIVPAEEWLDGVTEKQQQKFAALFVRLGDHGKIWNEQKFKHLTGTNQVFEFKVDDGRILSFFFFGRRLILTHGFTKKSAKTPKGEIERAESYKKDFEEREK